MPFHHHHHALLAPLLVGALLPFLACGITESEPTPEAHFWVGCRAFKDSLTEFKNESYAASEYFWDFGNGATSTEATPSVRYADTGLFGWCAKTPMEFAPKSWTRLRCLRHPLLP